MNQVTINSNDHYFEEGQTILDLLKQINIEIPALCHDERLHPASVCRLCLVKISGVDRLQPSCRTPLTPGMIIETHLPEIEDYRKGILQMLAKDYPLNEVIRYPQKEFHRWLDHYGLTKEMENTAS